MIVSARGLPCSAVTHVQVQRFAEGARLLGAVEDGDLLDGRGQGCQEVLHGERTVQADLDQADFFAVAR